MDRRLPERRLAFRALPVLAGAALCLAAVAMSADPESRPVPLTSAPEAGAAGFPWLPLLITLGALAVVAWARLRRGAAQPDASAGIRILSRTVMGRGRALSLVQVGDRVVLLGESAQGFQRLAEFESGQASVATPRRVAV
jgi:flagellar biogenesis protein FliO